MLGLGGRTGVGGDLGAFEVLLDPHETDLEALGPGLGLLERDIAGQLDARKVHRSKASLGGQADVIDAPGIDADDVTADAVEGHLAIAHDDKVQRKGLGRQHAAFAGDDGVDGDKLRLNDVLQVGDLLVEAMVVIDQPMAIVLNADVVFHREGHRGPRMGLKLRHVDEEVRLGNRLRSEDVVAQTLGMGIGNLQLRHLVKKVPFDTGQSGKERVIP